MIEDLFAARVEAEFIEGDSPMALDGEELESISHASGGRVVEFNNGRVCAKRALERLGIKDASIPMGDKREPVWPDGVVGSISHARGCAVAVVSDDISVSLGVDVEQVDRLERKLWMKTFTESEQEWLFVQKDSDRLASIFFAAKEALYKAQFPLTGEYWGLLEVEVEMDEEGFLSFRKDSKKLSGVGARYVIKGEYVVVGLEVKVEDFIYLVGGG